MNLSERDRQDLEELAGIFLSPAPAPGPREAVPEARPALCLVASLEDGGGPAAALVRAAEKVARAVPLPAGEPGTVHPLLRPGPGPRGWPADGPGFLPVPSRDGPELRWGLAATSRVLAWLPVRPGLLHRAEDFLLVLREACPVPELGWLRAPDLPFAPIEAVLASWRIRIPGARSVALGTWQPGEDLPAAARDFLLTAPASRLAPPAAAAQVPRQVT